MIRLRPGRQGFPIALAVTVGTVGGIAGLAYVPGQVLAYISLIFGALFFMFAARYYVAILAVLFAPSVSALNGKTGTKEADPPANGNGNNGHPMISVHLALYNEERVVDRLLTACSKLDYPNYEMVVVDDSKDGTVKILKDWILRQMETTLPRIKIVHRESREGFKGGALNEALRRTNPRAEFVVVFDADFVPPPDILKKFLAYFNRHSPNGSANGYAPANGNGRYTNGKLAAVQGYQWHTLNRSENWLTRGISCEFAGSYMVDRTFQEVAGTLKMVAGSVYMIRADLLRKYRWSSSITEDWELTLRLYEEGHKVLYTPLVQAPGECPSTLGKLVKQRMRWAEGHTHNVKKHFLRVLTSSKVGLREKLEFLYFAPYYLQSVFLIVGTLCWFGSDAILGTRLPYWTATFGWALVFTNLLALPLMSLTGLFFEKRAGKDFPGLFSQFLLIYALAPYQAYASVKGLLEPVEGSWVRTFKSGRLAGFPGKLEPRRVIKNVLPPRRGPASKSSKVPLIMVFGLGVLLLAALANGAYSTGQAQPSYYFYDQAAPTGYSPYPNSIAGLSFLMHTTPPIGQESAATIGGYQGQGPLFFSDPAPSEALLPYGASVSIHAWVNVTTSNWSAGSTASGPLWFTTTQAPQEVGTLKFRVDLYNPANNSVSEIPGASQTAALELKPGVNYYSMSWGSIGANVIIPRGDTLLVAIWCPDCSSPPTLLFNSATYQSSIDFPIVVPEDSLAAAPIALIVPMVAGLVLDSRRHSRQADNDGSNSGFRKVQMSIIAAAAILLLTIPLVITFSSFLTTVATATGFDRVVSLTVPFEAAAVADLLKGFGFPAGANATSVWLSGGFVPVVALIDWNCAGWQGFVLFGITSAAGLGDVRSNSRRALLLVVGAAGIFVVNVARILVVVLIGYFLGYPAATVFHEYGGTILTLAWLLCFWAVALRHQGGRSDSVEARDESD